MIMAMIFIVISICGVLQIYLSLKKTKEIKGKILSTNIIASQEVANKNNHSKIQWQEFLFLLKSFMLI